MAWSPGRRPACSNDGRPPRGGSPAAGPRPALAGPATTARLSALLAAAIFLAGCGVRSMIYPAPPVAVGPPPPPLEETTWALASGVELHGWHFRAARPEAPAVLFLHGNGENLETMRRSGLVGDLTGLGVHFALLDYPGYGRSGGSPSEPLVLEGAAAALDWLVDRHPDSPPVAAGWSLGAAVAVWLAAEHPQRVAGLIALSPWTSIADVASAHFPRWLVGILLHERYDSLAAAARVRSPALVIHGAVDRVIPVEQGERVGRALGARARTRVVPSAGHNDLLARPEVWREMDAFLAGIDPGAGASARDPADPARPDIGL